MPAGDWRTWDPLTYMRNDLSAEALVRCRAELWGEDDESGELKVVGYARNGESNACVFALMIAISPHVLRNARSSSGTPLLHVIIEYLGADVAELFVKYDPVSRCLVDSEGNTAFHVAARRGDHGALSALCEDPKQGNNLSRKHPYFCECVWCETVFTCGEQNHAGMAPVHVVSQLESYKEFKDCMTILTKYCGVNINTRMSSDGNTVSHMAIMRKSPSRLELCLNLGARANIRNHMGYEPQHIAYLTSELFMVKMCQEADHGTARPEDMREMYVFGKTPALPIVKAVIAAMGDSPPGSGAWQYEPVECA
jgi:ankyrin repeat protein